MVEAVSRPYASRIAGTPTRMGFDVSTGVLTLAYDDAVDAPNVVYVPERYEVTQVTCDGAGLPLTRAGARVEIPCGGGGSHEVRVRLSVR